MNYYFIETVWHNSGGSKEGIRARPLPNQGLDTNMFVECSTKMRQSQPVGAVFEIQATVTSKEGGTPFLYTSYRWPYRIVSRKEAEEAIKKRFKKI